VVYGLITISQERDNLIVEYIADNNCKVTESKVIAYMKSDAVEHRLRLTDVPVYRAIDRLIKAERITICNKEHRRGQPHYLGIDPKSKFDEIIRTLSNINKDVIRLHDPTSNKKIPEVIREYKRAWVPNVDHFITQYHILLSQTKYQIHTDVESKICFDRITESLINLVNRNFVVKRKVNQLKEYVKYEASKHKH
jgi:predicted transcriptional regulator